MPKEHNQEPPLTMTVDEACRILKIGRNQGYEGVRRGDIPSIRVGRSIKVLTKPLLRMLQAQ